MNEDEMNGSDQSTGVSVDDLAGLIALDKALREAKFNPAPVDEAVAASPIVADLSRRVRAAINVRTFGTPDPFDREDMIQPGRREWTVSVRAARRLRTWSTWTLEQKGEVAKDLLSPFGVSDENLVLFVNEVDSSEGGGV
jgi:hypothetical protein